MEKNEIINQIFENVIKPLCTHPETGEQCEADYSYAKDAYDIVIEGLCSGDSLMDLSNPLIKHLQNHNPHHMLVITNNRAELFSAIESTGPVNDL